MAIFWKKNTTDNQVVRRCLNCGKDISNKRKDARFCSNACWQGYHSIPESLTTFEPPKKQRIINYEQDDR